MPRGREKHSTCAFFPSTDAKEAAKNVGAVGEGRPWLRYEKLKRTGNCMWKSYFAVYLLTSLRLTVNKARKNRNPRDFRAVLKPASLREPMSSIFRRHQLQDGY